jgi:hypothetical protein
VKREQENGAGRKGIPKKTFYMASTGWDKVIGLQHPEFRTWLIPALKPMSGSADGKIPSWVLSHVRTHASRWIRYSRGVYGGSKWQVDWLFICFAIFFWCFCSSIRLPPPFITGNEFDANIAAGLAKVGLSPPPTFVTLTQALLATMYEAICSILSSSSLPKFLLQ